MKTFLLTLAATIAAAGCLDPAGPKPDGKAANPPPAVAVPTAAAAFQKPLPATVADDPRVVQAKAATDTVTRSLATIQERLTAHRKSYDDKLAAAEKDLRSLVRRLLPLAQAAREDCDTIQRAVLDLRVETRHAAAGYQAAADLYRDRAKSYSDPDLRAITAAMADEFERLAADVPRRRAILNAFNWQLSETALFLADTERCLRETDAALGILGAGPEPVTVSAQSKAFRRQLERFFALLEEYQRKLLGPPQSPEAPGEPPVPEPKSGDRAPPKPSPPAGKPVTGDGGTAPPRPTPDAERNPPAPDTAPPPSVPKTSSAPTPPTFGTASPGRQSLPPGVAVHHPPPPGEAAKGKRP